MIIINKNEKNKKLIKRVFLIVIICLIVLIAAYFILKYIASKNPDYGYDFYEADYSENIYDDPEYLDLNRVISYTNEMNETVDIPDGNFTKYGIGVEVLAYYFDSIQRGDEVTYNALFSKEYLKKNKEQERFTAQKIYDINIKLLSQYEDDEDPDNITTTYNYSIDYKIFKNNGTFRTDIGSDMSRTQYVTIFSDKNDTSITGISSTFRKK